MSLDALTTITGLLVYGYGTITILARIQPSNLSSLLAGLCLLIAYSSIYLALGWFLIWLDHTYYPQLQNHGDHA